VVTLIIAIVDNMPRGADAKLRRRNRKQEAAANAGRMFDGTDADDGDGGDGGGKNAHDFGLPLPPGMATETGEDDDDDDDSSEDEDADAAKKKGATTRGAVRGEPLIIKKKKKKMSTCCDNHDDDDRPVGPKKKQGIKTTPLILLLLIVGTAVLPALIYASDFQRNHVLGQIGFRLGMGAVPRKRVISFYEKHDPNKLDEVPAILSKYYGDYPVLIKKLERKYQDYGYFLDWENDDAPLALALDQLREAYSTWIHSYWNVYAPQPLKTAARNMRYNLAGLHKKFRKVWRKHLWPILEPVLGVPKGGEKQKRKDAAEARRRKQSAGGAAAGTRKRSSEFRDDVDDEM
jgi:hypothetical protein